MTILTPEEKIRYEGYLSEAESALHRLNMGGSVRVFVDQNGERIEYTAANRQSLRSYIMELRVKLGLSSGIVGPMRPWF